MVTVVTREPEYDQEQYDLLSALTEYEASLGHHGLPLEETMSPDADPDNPNGKYVYVPRAQRDWYDDAIEQAENDPKWKNNPSRARKFTAVRVDRE
jgi:hypothetical protein